MPRGQADLPVASRTADTGSPYRKSKLRQDQPSGLRGPGVYVLELPGGNYYVGKSRNRRSRIRDHTSPRSRHGSPTAAWCSVHGPPVQVLEPVIPPTSDLDGWEQKETIIRMLKHGFDKVRGWEFTGKDLSLPPEELEMVKTLITASGDLCRKCGHYGHFASSCKSTAKAAWLADIEYLIARGREVGRSKETKKKKALKPAHEGALLNQDGLPVWTVLGWSFGSRNISCDKCGSHMHSTSECNLEVDIASMIQIAASQYVPLTVESELKIFRS